MNIGIILSGGTGTRFGGNIPKQYLFLNGRKVIDYTIQAFERCSLLDGYIITTSEAYKASLDKTALITKGKVIQGGNTRNESLRAALDDIQRRYPECRNVFIHEAARPFITEQIVESYIRRLTDYDAVITTKKITDSLGSVEKWYVNRENYYLVQAPEAFRFGLINQYFRADSPITATVQQLPETSKVYHNYEFVNNFKITYPEDLCLAEIVLRNKENYQGE